MDTQHDVYYTLAPGIDVVPLSDGHLLFRSDTLAIRVEGESAQLLAEHVLPLLDGRHALSVIAARLPDVSAQDLRQSLDALVEAQVLRRADHPPAAQPLAEQALEPFVALLDAVGIPAEQAREQLRQLRVAIFGLEAHGAHLAALLARCGVGSIVLVDPYPCEPGNLGLMPLVGAEAIGVPRQDALRAALETQGAPGELLLGDRELTRAGVAALAAGCHMLVGCFDKGFSSTHHWINRASLEYGIPAIYAEARAHTALVGPLVLPGETACYMCYRMRSIACADDFSEAMSYEEFLDQRKRPALHERGTLPTLPPYIASLLALEILKHLLSLSHTSLAGKVLEFDALSLQTQTHAVLQKPDCPVCQKKKQPRPHPTFAELIEHDEAPGDVLRAAPRLLSKRTGIVKQFEQVQKDISEPARPYVFRAEVANHRFLEKETANQRVCSGKGMTLDAARASALGEAVERYAGGCWDYDEIVYARRTDLPGAALDPRELVLYAPDQYARLPYAPYADESILGWVAARSLISDQPMFVPALAVLMSYEVRFPEEFIFPITSNGLAAGPTLLDAVLGATFEVLERDAFMIAWLNRLPCDRIDPASHPQADVRELCEASRRRGVELQLYRVPTDHPAHVFVTFGVQAAGLDGPAAVVGLGADIDPTRAARKAILEVAQIRPALRKRMRRPETQRRMAELIADPRRVAELEDHDLLYASHAAIDALDFLQRRPIRSFEWPAQEPPGPTDKLRRLREHFGAQGGDLLYYNLTPPDLRTLGLHAARVIIPGFQPIDFGWHERRLGGERMYELPQRLGLAAARTTRAQLNPDPHPVS